MNNPKKIHFIGIGGSAMGSVALMLKEAGYNVQGSDSELYPPMSDCLRDSGILVFSHFAEANITPDVDLVVIGNAISRGNVELELLLNSKIRYAAFPEVIREFFIRGNKSIVVTGTHGKTTTSSLVAWILHNAGRKTGFLIGGIPLNFNRGYATPPKSGGYFVTEGDEYDTAFFDKRSKFMHYLPDVLILNNLEFDHADIFDSLDDIKKSFRHLIRTIPSNGLIVANADDDNVRDVTSKVFSRLVTFGIERKADYTAKIFSTDAQKTKIMIIKKSESAVEIETTMKGKHNIYNIISAFATLDQLGVTIKEFQSGVSSFKIVKRRLENVGEVNGITVYDDFAHHPTAIKSTIAGVRRAVPERRIIALFEPRSNTSRKNTFQDSFPDALSGADIVIIGKVYNYEKMTESERLNPFKLVDDIKALGVDAHYIPDSGELCDYIVKNALCGDIILAMSSGSFYGIHKRIIDSLKERYSRWTRYSK